MAVSVLVVVVGMFTLKLFVFLCAADSPQTSASKPNEKRDLVPRRVLTTIMTPSVKA
jgi:hypothetical protein